MFSSFILLFSPSVFSNIHFLVAIFDSFKNANVAFISFSVHSSLLRLSSILASVLNLNFVYSTVFLSIFCSALYYLHLIKICFSVYLILYIWHKLFLRVKSLTKYDLKYSCSSLIWVKIINISLSACLSSFNFIFIFKSVWSLLYCCLFN